MVSSPSPKRGLTSASSTAGSPSHISSSHSTPSSALEHLWSYIPFLSPPSSGRSTPVRNALETSTSRASCSTRRCLSYCCCTTSEPLKLSPQSRPSSTLHLRPKSYKRHRIMSATHPAHSSHSSTSSASQSDSGSDKDEQSGSLKTSAHRRTRIPSTNDPTNTVATTTTTTTTTTTEATKEISDNSGRQLDHGMADGPYLFVCEVALSLHYPIRALILFVLGFIFSMIIDHLQSQHQLVEYPNNGSRLWDTASWLPPTCGASAVLIGTIYPLGDYLWWGKRVKHNGRDWSNVMRCMGGFIGVNYAASKLPWTSSLQVSCTLALISAGLWFLFDRTFHGFLISLTVASMGTVVAYFLVVNGWYSFTRADFFGVGSWMPCILYSSSVCFGSIGRQLDVVPETWFRWNETSRAHAKSE